LKNKLILFCQKRLTFEEVIKRFSNRVYEAEFDRVIEVVNGVVELINKEAKDLKHWAFSF